jgi:hypothetical protein
LIVVYSVVDLPRDDGRRGFSREMGSILIDEFE